MGIFSLTTKSKNLILVMIMIVLAAVAVAYVYYDIENKKEDPRTVKARQLLDTFNELSNSNNYYQQHCLLDSIKTIYENTNGYKNDSYEIGVVKNNRGTIYLKMAIYDSTGDANKDSLLTIAEIYTSEAIDIYANWIDDWDSLSKKEIKNRVHNLFIKDSIYFIEKNQNIEDVINSRVEDLILAKLEMPRRLSVAYTNLAIIKRNQYKQKESLDLYVKALKLWEDNYIAKENLGKLIGKELDTPSALQKMFPKNRKSEE